MRRLTPINLVLCSSFLALVACGKSPNAVDPRTQVPVVKTATIQSATTSTTTFSGIVAARVQSDLAFRVSGKVIERLVDTGQIVRRGQPLMRLDPVDLGLQARAQQDAVAAAKAHAKQTADDEIRYRDLVAAGAVSASTYDQIKASADSAKAQLSAEQARADVAHNASGYAVLLADADGVIVETLAEPGQVVNPGQAVVRLAHAGQREAIVHLPETVRPAAGTVASATLYGKDNIHLPAKLRLLSNAADPLTRTFEARYVLEGELSDAPLGATVNIDIQQGNASDGGWQVPTAAIEDAGKGPGVWLVSGSPAKVNWRPVHVLSIGDETSRISGSLKSGEQIAALGVHLLHEGEHVAIVAKEGVHP